ncbi:MAG: hypothetical protein GYA51_12035 [Candidatus Methanofastidiosa archaeon]|nr:hypothetical protein [Candidatus Methanofastidiosa archaeon]
MKKQNTGNPFQITSPEGLTASEMVLLFVDVFSDFEKIINPGNVFLVGPRGAGKSMMFRFLQPDCQILASKCKFSELPFIGILISIKNANLNLSELKRFENVHASNILNEHIMVMYFCSCIFNTLSNPEIISNDRFDSDEVTNFYNKSILQKIPEYIEGYDNFKLRGIKKATKIFQKIAQISNAFYLDAFNYSKNLAFDNKLVPYKRPIYDFINFLVPILRSLIDLKGFPKSPIYLLIDDAHFLSDTQTKILNTWVSTRTSRFVSLKISTEYNYKSYYTITGNIIETPHDYSEVDITTIYTGNRKSMYKKRIIDIVEKRLTLYGITNKDPYIFFPPNLDQENKIKEIADKYRKKFDEGRGKGYYPSDDAIRYSRPDYIKSLAGPKKSSSTYSYSGFDQLVHLSSGIVRFFLEAANFMYAEEFAKNKNIKIELIPANVQNEIIRKQAEKFFFISLENSGKGNEKEENKIPNEDIKKLANLINGLGGLFRQILLSESRSERRIFSIAFSDIPSDATLKILNLGIKLGYFHKSTIGRKDPISGGRTRLYVLTRSLAPLWNLDPTSFAGYLFVTNKLIEEAMTNPYAMLRRIGKTGFPEKYDIVQLELFEDD